MQAPRAPIDGLWRCLCPPIDSILYSQTLRPRTLHLAINARRSNDQKFASHQPRAYHGHTYHNERPLRNNASQKLPLIEKKTRKQKANAAEDLGQLSTPELHERLAYLKSRANSYHAITNLVEYLVTVRGEKPALIHYDALIGANADPKHGSAKVVRRLLNEMKETGIGAGSKLYHTVLETLAIHPDYLFRAEIMQEIKERWVRLSPDGWHNLVLGLLRDRQLEVAMDKLNQMSSHDIKVQQCLYDIFLYQLCEADELDEAFKLLTQINLVHLRISQFTPHMWYYLLDSFSKAFHYEGTKYIWYSRVPQLYLKPTDGICVSVLNTAARYGDQTLAIDAMRILSSRSMALTTHHYEALLAAHAKPGDFYNCFRILHVMSQAGIEPDTSSTRPLYAALVENAQSPLKAWEILKQLHHDGHPIHLAAINVVLESCEPKRQHKLALELYKELHTITEYKPNLETFNILLRGIRWFPQNAKAHCMFIASEIRAFNVKPDNVTYDRVILVCLKDDDYEDAFRYLAEMRQEGEQHGWWLREGTLKSLIRKLALKGDVRAFEILDEHARRTGRDWRSLRIYLEENWKGAVPGERLEKLSSDGGRMGVAV